jgi:hypothetical protein
MCVQTFRAQQALPGGPLAPAIAPIWESWLRKIGQRHEWIFCLTAARILAANQERR